MSEMLDTKWWEGILRQSSGKTFDIDQQEILVR